MNCFNVRLHNDAGKATGGVSVQGTAFLQGHLLQGERLRAAFGPVGGPDELREVLSTLNGFFNVVAVGKDRCFAAVDRLRSFPLFYGTAHGELFLSDEADWVRRQVGDIRRDTVAEREFLLTGYVTGADTLYPNVRQLQAGEYLFAHRSGGALTLRKGRYFRFQRMADPPELPDAFAQLDHTMVSAINRLIEVADGRTIVVPLSGGYDSRLIVALLKRLGYPNVLTFTYGRPGNREARVSQQVAESLGFEWRFVPYSNELWCEWFATPERERFFSSAHQHVSVPILQDWPAIWTLTVEGAVPRESVFVPGHTGDFIAGGHALRRFIGARRVSKAQLVEGIRERHYSLWPSSAKEREVMRRRIRERLDPLPSEALNGVRAIDAHDTWNWQERQSKFIMNSLRAYEFWGHHWWTPLWDAEVIRFWERVPLADRLDTGLLRAYVNQQYAATIGSEVAVCEPVRVHAAKGRLKRAIMAGPLAALIQEARRWHKRARTDEYRAHPLAWYGILDERTFRSLYTGRENINSFIARMLLANDQEEYVTRSEGEYS